MAEESPLVQLTYAILLSAVKKNAEKISLHAAAAPSTPVDFVIDGAIVEELALPTTMLGGVVRRLSIMANLPFHERGEEAEGHIHLLFGEAQSAWFALRVFGHGPELSATVRRVSGPRAQPVVRGQYR